MVSGQEGIAGVDPPGVGSGDQFGLCCLCGGVGSHSQSIRNTFFFCSGQLDRLFLVAGGFLLQTIAAVSTLYTDPWTMLRLLAAGNHSAHMTGKPSRRCFWTRLSRNPPGNEAAFFFFRGSTYQLDQEQRKQGVFWPGVI